MSFRRGSNLDARDGRRPGCEVSQKIRKRIEEANGWAKTRVGLARTPSDDVDRVRWMFQSRAIAYDLVRLPKLLAASEAVAETRLGPAKAFEAVGKVPN
jgi:hypothetical protein